MEVKMEEVGDMGVQGENHVTQPEVSDENVEDAQGYR